MMKTPTYDELVEATTQVMLSAPSPEMAEMAMAAGFQLSRESDMFWANAPEGTLEGYVVSTMLVLFAPDAVHEFINALISVDGEGTTNTDINGLLGL